MLKKWEVIKKQDVSPSKWFPIERHTVRLPNGREIDDYYLSPIGNIAMIVPVTKDGRMVFVRQYKHGIGEIMIELPAGMQKKDMSIEETAIVEPEEETGIYVKKENLEFIGKFAINPTKLFNITHTFLVRVIEFNSSQEFDETEEIEVMQIEPVEVLKMILNGEIWASDTVASIFLAKEKYPELFK